MIYSKMLLRSFHQHRHKHRGMTSLTRKCVLVAFFDINYVKYHIMRVLQEHNEMKNVINTSIFLKTTFQNMDLSVVECH